MAARNNFHFVRLAAASIVVIGHSYELLGHPAPGIFVFAVPMFFVVSGYLICESWNRDANLHRYLLRRSLRIFPALAVVVALSDLVLGPLATELPIGTYIHDPQIREYFWNIFLYPWFNLPGVFQHNPLNTAVNGSLWTLPAEFLMYLLLPLYGTATSAVCRSVVLPVLLLGTGAAGLFYALRPDEMTPVVWGTGVPQIFRWAPFFLGGAAFRVWKLERFLNMHAAVAALALIACSFASDLMRNLSLILLLPYATLAFCLTPSGFLDRHGSGSDISYGVYLSAYPIQQALIASFGPKLDPLQLLALAMPLSWLSGFASWHAVEKHALRLKPRVTP